VKGRDFLEILAISSDELSDLLELSSRLADEPALLSEGTRPGAVALLFEKPSLRTKSSFAVASWRLGLLPVAFGAEEVGLGKRESIGDAARNLDRFYDAIVHRTFGQDRVAGLAEHASVPVINALSDEEHPCQALADLLTLQRRFGRLEGLKLAYVGDGNNVLHSLLGACALAGVELACATPESAQPAASVMERARAAARAELSWTEDAATAVKDAHAIYTDTWISMGQEKEAASKRALFAGYRVDAALMSRARSDAIFLHCLPAHRGDEVTDEVMDSGASLVFTQAGHRLPTQQALLARLLGLA
jgi:ornithine carbamoyltransferase